MVTDEDLLERSLGGDIRAFEALVQRHESAVSAVSFAVTGDRGVSEDVAQDAFLLAWKSLPSLREPSRFKAWACGIARNLARKARIGEVRTAVMDRELVDPSPGAEELIDRADRDAAVWAALEQLSPTYREPLVLYYREGRSTKEVAEALGLTVSTVEQRLSRGRKHLRAEVMDMVEQTLEDRPPRGRVSAAVVAAIEVGGIPVGESAPASSAASPTTSSKTMKTALIATAAIAALGLGAVAVSTSNTGPEASPAETTAAVAPTPSPSDRRRRPAALEPDPADARPVAAKDEDEDGDASQSPDAASVVPATPFEVTRLGPARVAMNLAGGRSELSTRVRPETPAVVGHIEGIVRSPDGRPVEGAVVLGGGSLTMSFGTSITSSAGVSTDAQGRFALPVYSADHQVLLAAHRDYGMSRIVTTSTEADEPSLELKPFTYVEGTVREGDGGIPARAMLLGPRKPLIAFGGPTADDGTYRFGPLPPGAYTGAASTALQDRGNVTKFQESDIELRPGKPTTLDFTAREGTMIVLEAELPEDARGRIDLAVFPGEPQIESYEALRQKIKDTPRGEFEWLMRGGVDGNNGTANFHALEPGRYTGCIGVKPEHDDGGHFACKSVELEADEPEVISLEPFAD